MPLTSFLFIYSCKELSPLLSTVLGNLPIQKRIISSECSNLVFCCGMHETPIMALYIVRCSFPYQSFRKKICEYIVTVCHSFIFCSLLQKYILLVIVSLKLHCERCFPLDETSEDAVLWNGRIVHQSTVESYSIYHQT